MASYAQALKKLVYRRILHADDTPHRIALGVAVGVFVAFTPTICMQTALAVGLAALIGANKIVTIPFVWITNPLTSVPIYGGCWWLGAHLLPSSRLRDAGSILHQIDVASAHGTGFFTRFFEYDFWAGMASLMFQFGTELWLGCSIVGILFAVPLYFLTRSFVRTYRARYRARHSALMMRRHERRERRMAKRGLVAAAGETA